MGFDRVRYFDGVEPDTTLLTANKSSEEVVFSRRFKYFAHLLGFDSVRHVVDVNQISGRQDLRIAVNRGAQVVDFPDLARQEQLGQPIAVQAIELRPPLNETTKRALDAYLLAVCEPADDMIIVDHRTAGHQSLVGE